MLPLMCRARLLAAAFGTVLVSGHLGAQTAKTATGGIAGCITQSDASPLPRVTVTVAGMEMSIATMIDYPSPSGPLSALWNEADAVVHLRITGHKPGPLDGS